jgi:hypothetical protein
MARRLLWILLALIVAAGAARTLLATDGSGFTGTTLATARFGELDLNSHTLPANLWQARLKTQGLSDLYVQSNVWKAGGTTGWHTHPGPSLIVVTAGTITAYDGDDPECTPHVYAKGMGFVDAGDGHVHVLRNEDSMIEASTIAVQLVPATAGRRINAPDPGNCPATVN